MSDEPDVFRFGGTVIATTGSAPKVARADPVTASRPQADSLPGAGIAAESSAPPIAESSFLEMAASFTTSMARFASSGFKTVDRGSFRVRLEQCLSCEHRQGSRCKACGCFFDLKARLPHEDCPIGCWTG